MLPICGNVSTCVILVFLYSELGATVDMLEDSIEVKTRYEMPKVRKLSE